MALTIWILFLSLISLILLKIAQELGKQGGCVPATIVMIGYPTTVLLLLYFYTK